MRSLTSPFYFFWEALDIPNWAQSVILWNIFNDLNLVMFSRYGGCLLRRSVYILSRNYLSRSFSIQRKACLNGLRHLVLLPRWKIRSVSDLKMFRIFIWSINEHIFYKILGNSIAHLNLKRRYLTTGQQLVEFPFVLWSLVGSC